MPTVFSSEPETLELRRRAGVGWWANAWLPVVVAVGVIARESTPAFGAEHTSSWLRPLFERVFGVMSDDFWGTMHMLLRKSGHFFGYGLVCLTFVRAWLLTLARRVDTGVERWRSQSVAFGVVCTFAVASGDEWHQTFLPNRTGQFSDVLLDTMGGLTMCGLVALVFWRRRLAA